MVAFIKYICFVYVLYSMFTIIQSEEPTFFKEELTWFEAQRCCASRLGQLATLDYANGENVSCYNIPLLSSPLKIWTGNIRRLSEWIEFQGCFSITGPHVFANNISECYQKCFNDQQNAFVYFTYKKNKCICNIKHFRKADTFKCVHDSEIQRNYAWLYKVLYNASYDGNGNCVASKCTNGSQKNVTERCASSQIPMCGVGFGVPSSTNWTKSESNCKDPNSRENHATDRCETSKDTVKTGIWTNIFRVEISAHVDYGDMIKMTYVLSCVMANCPYAKVQISYFHTNCNVMADAFFCKPALNSTIMSSLDCKSKTTNIYNISKPHTIADTTVTGSSVSRNTHQLSSRTQNQHSTEALTTVNTDIGKTTATISASITKFNSNYVSKRTAHSSFLVTGITSVKLQAVVHSVDVTTTRIPSHKTTNITPTKDEQVGTKPEATNIGLICGVTVGGLVLIAVIAVIACKMRNVGPFRKQLYNDDTIEMNNSIECAIPVYHDTVLNTGNGSVPKDAIRNNTADDTSTSTGERQNKTSFSNHEYAVVVKKHPPGPATQPRPFDLEEDDNQGQRFETEDEYDTLKHTVDKGEEQIENNVYDSSLGVRDGVDPTYNSITIGQVNNDTTYDHTSNIVQKQVNSDRTYDLTSNIVQKQVNNDATYDHTF